MLLTDPEFIKQLEGLFLLARKVLGGSLRADRKSDKKGTGINFADYAEYRFGDDYRNIDWNVYGRLETLMIKLFELEEDIAIYVLIDTSRSMAQKHEYAAKLCAALGYIALNNADRLVIYGFADSLDTVLRPCHGRAKIFPMLRALERTTCEGPDTCFTESLKAFYAQPNRRGVCVVVSDFLIPGGYVEGLNFLRWAKHDIFCIQVLNPDELVCPWKGDIELECVETHRRYRTTVTPSRAAQFAQRFREYNQTIAAECARREIGFAAATTDVPFEAVVQRILREGGLVR
ncbi:MAG: DUF58 domain-containing protein [Candidatus Brocadiia bacterium]|nr:DUF58 domain-containing protein [Candidatus Brocadiia bacterium]